MLAYYQRCEDALDRIRPLAFEAATHDAGREATVYRIWRLAEEGLGTDAEVPPEYLPDPLPETPQEARSARATPDNENGSQPLAPLAFTTHE